MSNLMVASSSFYGAALLIVLSVAVVYCTRRQFLPYHSVAISRSWLELDEGQRQLLLALIHLVGWAWVAIAFAGFALLGAWHEQPGLVMALQALITLGTGPVIWVSTRVRLRTGASPPTFGCWIVLGLSLAGFLLAWPVWSQV